MRRRLKGKLGMLITGALGVVALLGLLALSVLYTGIYNVAATEQHIAPTFHALDIGLRRSVLHHARDIAVPSLAGGDVLERGFACFVAHCEQCHGGPGVPRAAFAQGLLPVPSSLSQASADWEPAQLYWITRNGIKMTGMPAWEYRLDDSALWALVAFLQELPRLTTQHYREWRMASSGSCAARSEHAQQSVPVGDPVRGQVAIQQYACTACHRIRGIVGPDSRTGPPLEAIGQRRYIAGVLPNSRDNLVRWLRTPQAVRPGSAMPDLGVTDADSRDIAAYLESLN